MRAHGIARQTYSAVKNHRLRITNIKGTPSEQQM